MHRTDARRRHLAPPSLVKAIEALPRVWVADAHGHPRHVLRVIAPLIDRHAPDGRPATPYGPHPYWLDGRVHQHDDTRLHPEPESRLRSWRINFFPGTIIARNPGDGTTPPMPCAGCQSIGRGFTMEWATDLDATLSTMGNVEQCTVTLECWVCAHLDRSVDATLTLSGYMASQGDTQRAQVLSIMAGMRTWVTPDAEIIALDQGEASG